MRIAFLGAGHVGAALADRVERAGHDVVLAARSERSESVARALAANPSLTSAPPEVAVDGAEVVVLATPFDAVASALPAVAARLAGRVLVDCTNPVGPGVSHALGGMTSGSERVRALAPGARVVKCFSVYGFENFRETPPPRGGLRPAMPLCGDDPAARDVVAGLARELGWEPADVGGLEQALALEHLALLWIRLVRVHGGQDFVWARMTR